MVSHSGLITVMQRAARKAAPRLRRDFGEVEQLQVSRKGPADFVSMADKRAEQTIVEELRNARPDWGCCSRKAARSRAIPTSRAGSSIRSMGRPISSTASRISPSRSRSRSGSPAAAPRSRQGLVYQPLTDESFWAEKGRGAWLNERRLRVSARRDLADALIGTGIPHSRAAATVPLGEDLRRVAPEVAGIRRFGSAALDLAWVAAGRMDGFWEDDLDLWDTAAGILLVREAGGFVTDYRGPTAVRTGEYVAANGELHQQAAQAVAGALR